MNTNITQKQLIFSLAIILSARSVCFGQALAPQLIQLSDQNVNLALGAGLDSLTGQPKATCINEIDEAKEKAQGNFNVEGTGAAGEMRLRLITSQEELSHELSLDANASFRYGVFKLDAAATYLATGSFTKYNTNLFVSSDGTNAKRRLTHYSLNGQGAEAYQKGPAAFKAKCGDLFVRGKIDGGSFRGILTGTSTSAEESQTQTAAFKAAINALAGGGNVQAAYRDVMQSSTHTGSVEVFIIRRGPAEAWPQADADSILKYAQEYPDKVAADKPGAWTTAYILSGYDQLAGSEL